MNFDLSEDQEALRDGIRSLCEGRFTSERVRAGFDRTMYDELDATGVFSLRRDGFGWADTGIAFQELGRALVPGPLVWTNLAQGLQGVEGVTTGIDLLSSPVSIVADSTELGNANRVMVEFGAHADSFVGLTEEGIVRFDLDRVHSSPELDWPLDPLTPVSVLERLPASELIAEPALAAAWRLCGAVLTSAYQVGMAQAAVETATTYALDRHQFDRPIGSFQAVKHLLADMAVRAEVARAAVDAAAVTLDSTLGERSDFGNDEIPTEVVRVVAGSRLLAGEAALKNAKGSLQVHGGMGFTWEVDVHLYLKRAWMLNTVFGTPVENADALAASLR